MPQIIPIRDLKKTAEISQMCHEATEPIFVTKNGYGDMVIMSVQVYEEKIRKLEIYDKLNAAEEQVAQGKLRDADSSIKELRAKYNV